MRPFTKWPRVVHRIACFTSFTTSDKVRQIIGRTLVRVSIHLECWLDKARVKIVTWVAMGVAHQQQFSYNLVLNFGCVNAVDVDSIRIGCASGECKFNSHSKGIKCEKASTHPFQLHYTCNQTDYHMPSAHAH